MLTSSKAPIKILTLRKIARSNCYAKFSQHPPFRLSKSFFKTKPAPTSALKASTDCDSHVANSSSQRRNKHKCPKPKRFSSLIGNAFILVAAVVFVASIAINAALSYFRMYFNVSESLPYGLYKITYINEQGLNPFAFKANHDEAQKGGAMIATDASYIVGVADDMSAVHGEDRAGLADGHDYSLELVSNNSYSLERGMLVLACLPDGVAKIAYERNYIASGKCKGGYAPVGKYIQAVAGDEVRFTSEGIFVNGKLIEHSKPYEMDGEGRPMPLLQQEMVLPKDELVLVNSYAGSFDSRYYGPIPSRYVLGTLKPVITF